MRYRADIDCLKGLAILSVVLFHIGLLKTGYLGVDVFFVINGFLVVPAICDGIKSGGFSYFRFLEKKLLRLLPLVVIVSFICLLIGYIGMLPDNYENLAESVVASNLFSENILSAFTTKDYWNINNDYKPLMHLWYVGILFEFYLLFPLFVLGIRRICSRIGTCLENGMLHFMEIMFVISFLLFLLPIDTEGNKFYFIQYRSFELLFGGIIGTIAANGKIRWKKDVLVRYQWVCNCLLCLVLFSGIFFLDIDNVGRQIVPIGADSDLFAAKGLMFNKSALLVMTVALSGLFVANGDMRTFLFHSPVLKYLGKRSYSIFIWHQVLLAFYRYFISDRITVPFVILFLIVAFSIAEISYRYVEVKVRVCLKSLLLWIGLSGLLIMISMSIYLNAGVVRDVPELNISVSTAHRNLHSEYCDRIYAYDGDFPSENGKINVLVEGVSFGRDFANCLLESPYRDRINLSYIYRWSEDCIDRVKEADYIFTFSIKENVPSYVWNNAKGVSGIYGIGTKNFGRSNGIIYSQRFRKDYFESVVPIEPEYKALNDEWSEEWGDSYIDFIKMATVRDGYVRVFTPEGKFISQDCEHLTREGAEWYATIIDWNALFCNVSPNKNSNNHKL